MISVVSAHSGKVRPEVYECQNLSLDWASSGAREEGRTQSFRDPAYLRINKVPRAQINQTRQIVSSLLPGRWYRSTNDNQKKVLWRWLKWEERGTSTPFHLTFLNSRLSFLLHFIFDVDLYFARRIYILVNFLRRRPLLLLGAFFRFRTSIFHFGVLYLCSLSYTNCMLQYCVCHGKVFHFVSKYSIRSTLWAL